jgi:hypothetical protein
VPRRFRLGPHDAIRRCLRCVFSGRRRCDNPAARNLAATALMPLLGSLSHLDGTSLCVAVRVLQQVHPLLPKWILPNSPTFPLCSFIYFPISPGGLSCSPVGGAIMKNRAPEDVLPGRRMEESSILTTVTASRAGGFHIGNFMRSCRD